MTPTTTPTVAEERIEAIARALYEKHHPDKMYETWDAAKEKLPKLKAAYLSDAQVAADAFLALQAPTLPVPLKEIEAALEAAGFLSDLPFDPVKSADQIRLDVPNVVGQVNALIKLLNAWPALRQLHARAWSPGIWTTPAIRSVMNERKRQIEKEGWTPEHDDEHSDGALADAAACYAMSERAVALVDDLFLSATNQQRLSEHPYEWPFDAEWWKPKDRRSDLVRAGALILAEIERLDRAALPDAPTPPRGPSND